MHILFVTPNLPVPTSSARVRPFNLIKQLAVRHQVSVLSFIQPSEYSMLQTLEPYCQRIELVPLERFRHLNKWQNRLRGWLLLLFSSRPRALYTFPVKAMREPLQTLDRTSKVDVVHFEQLYLTELRSEVRALPAVLGEQNVEFQVIKNLQKASSNPIHKIRDELSWRKMYAFEKRWIQQFPVCLAVSEQDARVFRQVSGDTEIHVVTNGVDNQTFSPQGSGLGRRTDNVLFFGTLNYGPNKDGIKWFCQDIWPMIHSVEPDVELEIVGIDPPPDVTALGELPGVKITGFVPDIRRKLWSATLSIAPLRWGGGTRLKIIEALAAGCPMVSTSAGAEGLDLEDGKEILIADTADDFARAVIDLLQHPAKRAALSAAGQNSAAEKYDWSAIALRLEKAYSRAIELTAPGSAIS
jgi:glycosyltransferase involved in cell wall biosynthesis